MSLIAVTRLRWYRYSSESPALSLWEVAKMQMACEMYCLCSSSAEVKWFHSLCAKLASSTYQKAPLLSHQSQYKSPTKYKTLHTKDSSSSLCFVWNSSSEKKWNKLYKPCGFAGLRYETPSLLKKITAQL